MYVNYKKKNKDVEDKYTSHQIEICRFQMLNL